MATPAVEKQAEPRSAVAAREAGARQADGAARDETTLGPDVQSVLGLQASAGNAAVTELLGGGGAIEARPPAASPDLGGLNPFEALSRAGRLPPLQLLESLGGVGAAIAQAGEREHAALSAAAPRWTAQPDLPTGQPPARGPTPALEQAVVVESSPGTGAGPEGEDLAHRHAAFQHLLQQEGAMHARQAVEPLGEHAIAASGPPATAVAAIPGRSAPVTEPVTPADGDEGVSRVAEDERGPEIRSAIAGGVPALEAEQAAHTRAKADLEADAHREMTALEAENRGQRNAERAAAGAEVAGLRQAWQGEHRTALAESTAAGVAAAAAARSQITEQHAEAEREATAARAQGKAQAEAAEQHGREQAAQEQKKAQGGQPGGILGAIGSAAQSVVSQVGHAVSAVMDRVRQTVTSVLQQAEHVAAQAIEKGRRMIAATIGVAAGAFEAARTRASTLLNGARDRFRTAILERVARARATVSGLMSALQHKLQRALDASGRAMAASVQRLEAGWRATLGGVRAVVEGAVQFARSAIQALGAFAPIVRDVAANPVQWVSNLAAGAQDGIRNHLWPDLQDAVRGWVEGKVDDVLGLTSAVWDALRRGGIAVKDVGQMLWDGLKAAIPPTLISILIEKIVSLLVPAAGAALLIVQSIQAAWASLSSIVKAGDAFMHFLKSVRWGNAGPLFGKALGAGAVAVIDFVSNFLLQRIGGPIKKVAGRVKRLAGRLTGGVKTGLARVGRNVKNEWQTVEQTGRLALKARMAAPKIRGELESLASASGGKLVGLDHEFKTFRSLHEKVGRRIALGSAAEDVGAGIKDALRYTVVFDPGEYAASTKQLFEYLRGAGYKAFDYKNRWYEGQAYVGINLGYISPSGHSFELQIHTAGSEGSWYSKEFLTHKDYKKLARTRDPAALQELEERMIETNKHVAIPVGAKDIPSPVDE